ncbi:MAG: serine protease, partial [Terrimicrobiaceae bacterium]
MFRILIAVLFATGVLQASPVARSLVRIEATSQEPDYKAPWNPGEVSGGVGAGFIISGNRIMTNAHVVSNARFLTVSKEGDPKP